jgi:primosomal protein N' (replication factor Y)
VVVQTSQPEHPVMLCMAKNDFVGLFNQQMSERKLFKYPPYVRLVKIVIKHKNKERLDLVAANTASTFRKIFNKNVLGPEYPVVSRIQTFFQKEILIKLPRDGKVLEAKDKILDVINKTKAQPNNSQLIIYADVDPM